MKPFVVEKRPRPRRVDGASGPRRPDSKIRVWRDDDKERQDQESFDKQSKSQQFEGLITAWCQRFRRANDPDVERRIALQSIGCDMAADATSHEQVIHGPEPRIVIWPKKGRIEDLKQARQMQSDATQRVVTDPKGPKSRGYFAFWRKYREG